MEGTQLPDFIIDLQKTDRYDHPVQSVQLIQTHISYVLIAGDFVYKIKKPVDFGFLNFTTLEKRAYYCEQELILNRRLCPDLYLDRVTITADSDGFHLNGRGEVVDYGVKMARLPEQRMMGKLLGEKKVDEGHMDAIVATLVPFYRSAAGDERIRAYGTAASVGINVLENFEQTEEFVGGPALSRTQFTCIRDYAKHVLQDESRFIGRIESGHIRDCHGDLYSANICLDDQVHIFDCIEFNERFRYSDVAADVAFLAMDLDLHGNRELSSYFTHRFAAASEDPELLNQVDFYKCYRAYVRGKIGLFTAADPAVDPKTAQTCTEQAGSYFRLAEQYAEQNS